MTRTSEPIRLDFVTDYIVAKVKPNFNDIDRIVRYNMVDPDGIKKWAFASFKTDNRMIHEESSYNEQDLAFAMVDYVVKHKLEIA
jgi:hypothetical protein